MEVDIPEEMQRGTKLKSIQTQEYTLIIPIKKC